MHTSVSQKPERTNPNESRKHSPFRGSFLEREALLLEQLEVCGAQVAGAFLRGVGRGSALSDKWRPLQS